MLSTKAKHTNVITEREKANANVAYRIATEGIVLLKNDGVLPIEPKRIALFGAGAGYTIAGGSGSGEVTSRYTINVLDGLRNTGFTITTMDWINRYDVLFQTGKEAFLASVRKSISTFNAKALGNLLAAEFLYPTGDKISEEEIKQSDTDTCLYVVARQSGEGRDRKNEEGNFKLDEVEIENIKLCAKLYPSFVLIINSGCIIDLSPLDGVEGINAIVYMGQLGMEGGNALASILTGKANPSGKLTITWGNTYLDYPYGNDFGIYAKDLLEANYKEGLFVGYRYFDSFEKEVRYPFGFGLSYTTFDYEATGIEQKEEVIQIHTKVKNTGACSGKEVVQFYVNEPSTTQIKPYQKLIGFLKTKELSPNEQEELTLSIPLSYFSSYEEKTGETYLEEGNYVLKMGNHSRNTKPIACIYISNRIVLSKHKNVCVPARKIAELIPSADKHENVKGLPTITIDYPNEPTVFTYEVPEEAFLPSVNTHLQNLKNEEKIQLVAGTGLFGNKTGFSVPGAVGHTTTNFIKQGIPNIELCDGPAGVRLQRRSALTKRGKIKPIDASISIYEYLPKFISRFVFGNPNKDKVLYQFVTAFPIASVVAQTWNEELANEMGEAVSEEMYEYGATVWLAPAINIVRNPLCGRNFEYYSEDPILSGKIGAAITRGTQRNHPTFVTIKHFACNNQETERTSNSSNLDERVLREIYLKAFEIVVKEGKAKGFMSAYNKINGTYAANSRELCTDVLRGEWNYEGIVMTDWFSTAKGKALDVGCINAGVDLIMPGGKGVLKQLKEGLKNNALNQTDLDRSTSRVLNILLQSDVKVD
ncbi:MAG: glycoside hydrolase family 3 C-terminal domain-containing protein [Solobacterium sp.]|nr:glycoside hydrolase family 3 C-terminal domain-containing protein [Solobacterium sp.]